MTDSTTPTLVLIGQRSNTLIRKYNEMKCFIRNNEDYVYGINVSRKMDYHAGGKLFIHGPKRSKENQLLSLKHPCWLSIGLSLKYTRLILTI